MDEYMGIVKLFAGNFPIKGWAFCNGQLLSISQNSALYSLLGNTYGGDGVSTFALPDLRGRTAVGFGSGPGLQNYNLGEAGGTESVTLTNNQLPVHTHSLNATTNSGTQVSPSGVLLAAATGADEGGTSVTVSTYANGSPNTSLSPNSIGGAGGNQPHENRQPYLGLNYIICTEGLYPPRP
ncbi:phage tail protein [Spirosoma agri]|uniref:Phage tail protein n=1 Tax=Spirosoma agri TaxID=1987381 RepID=A0A6M0IIS9_9BACT|nr:tail fiber protein [Spirosoma agri]NEU68158.1 phage tail protein [Spirosoma agri]